MSNQPKTDILNTLVQTVRQDVELWEKNGQWIFSSYSPAKECASIPGVGLDDISPEELRYESYNANVTNSMGAHQQKVQQLGQTYANIRRQLLNPTQAIKETLLKIYYKEGINNQSSNFGSFKQPNSNRSLFGGGEFSPSSNVFGGSSFGGSKPFGSSNNSPASIFGGTQPTSQASSNLFGGTQKQGGLFGGSGAAAPAPAPSSNLFASFHQKSSPQQGNFFGSSPPVNNVFSSQPSPGGIFSQNTTEAKTGGNIFSMNSNIFGGNYETETMIEEVSSSSGTQALNPSNETPVLTAKPIFKSVESTDAKVGLFGQVLNKAEDPSTYSKLEELKPEEIEVFKSRNFVLGKIPERPPPKELCH